MKELSEEMKENLEYMIAAGDRYDSGNLVFDYQQMKQDEDFDLLPFITGLKFCLSRNQCIKIMRDLVTEGVIDLPQYKQLLQEHFLHFRGSPFARRRH